MSNVFVDEVLFAIHDLHVKMEDLYQHRESLERDNAPDVPIEERNKIANRLLDVSSHPALHTCLRQGETWTRQRRRQG